MRAAAPLRITHYVPDVPLLFHYIAPDPSLGVQIDILCGARENDVGSKYDNGPQFGLGRSEDLIN